MLETELVASGCRVHIAHRAGLGSGGSQLPRQRAHTVETREIQGIASGLLAEGMAAGHDRNERQHTLRYA